MKSQAFLLLLLFSLSVNAETYDESIHHPTGFQIWQNDPRLKDLLPGNGHSSICWPSSLANRMIFLKWYNTPKYSQLAVPTIAPEKPDIAQTVRKFVNLCHTSLTGGTAQNRKLPCIQEFLHESGYGSTAQIIGRSATFPMNTPGSQGHLRAVEVSDLRRFLKADYAVILHVGWLYFNPGKNSWEERGSHSLNAYGFNYDRSWGEDRIILEVANPGRNYSALPGNSPIPMQDWVTLSKVQITPGVRRPSNLRLRIDGPGFSGKPGRMAVLDDIFVFLPTGQR